MFSSLIVANVDVPPRGLAAGSYNSLTSQSQLKPLSLALWLVVLIIRIGFRLQGNPALYTVLLQDAHHLIIPGEEGDVVRRH
nr:hyp [Cotesia vestalis bracovirus]